MYHTIRKRLDQFSGSIPISYLPLNVCCFCNKVSMLFLSSPISVIRFVCLFCFQLEKTWYARIHSYGQVYIVYMRVSLHNTKHCSVFIKVYKNAWQ